MIAGYDWGKIMTCLTCTCVLVIKEAGWSMH